MKKNNKITPFNDSPEAQLVRKALAAVQTQDASALSDLQTAIDTTAPEVVNEVINKGSMSLEDWVRAANNIYTTGRNLYEVAQKLGIIKK